MLEENVHGVCVFMVLSFGELRYTRTPEVRLVRTNHGNPFRFASSSALFFSVLKQREYFAKRKVVPNAGTLSLGVF